jgi:hypothetical protein
LISYQLVSTLPPKQASVMSPPITPASVNQTQYFHPQPIKSKTLWRQRLAPWPHGPMAPWPSNRGLRQGPSSAACQLCRRGLLDAIDVGATAQRWSGVLQIGGNSVARYHLICLVSKFPTAVFKV